MVGPALLTAVLGAGCDALGTGTYEDEACACRLELGPGWMNNDFMYDDDEGLFLTETLGGRSLNAWKIDKASFERPVSAATIVDRVSEVEYWTGHEAELESVRRRQIARRDTRSEDDLDRYARRYHVIELPDRFIVVHTWTDLDQAESLAELDDAIAAVEATTPTDGDGFGVLQTPPTLAETDLRQARASIGLQAGEHSRWSTRPISEPPDGVRVVSYPSALGDLEAYVTEDPGDGQRRPAVLWAHDDWYGAHPTMFTAEDPVEQPSVRAFTDAGLVVMIPTWRGQHDNPGQFEFFGGEVDDLLAARDHLARLPYVDPRRIFLVGHGPGASLVLLAATVDQDFSAAVAISGLADVTHAYASGDGLGSNLPYDVDDTSQHQLRSAIHHVDRIRRPVLYISGEHGPYASQAARLQAAAEAVKAPVRVRTVPLANEVSATQAIHEHVAARITSGRGHFRGIDISPTKLLEIATQASSSQRETVQARIAEAAQQRLDAGFESDEELVSVLANLYGYDLGYPFERAVHLANATVARLAPDTAEAAGAWPPTTDCDRLDVAFAKLAERGFHVDAYGYANADVGFDGIEDAYAPDSPPPFAFYTQTDVHHALEHGQLYIGYGGASSPRGTIRVGKQIVEALEAAGLRDVRWNGDPSHRIRVDLTWQRRRTR